MFARILEVEALPAVRSFTAEETQISDALDFAAIRFCVPKPRSRVAARVCATL
jgi:hypothetical protein